jgi:hypothetical protein
MLQTKDPLTVFSGRTMRIQAHAQTGQGASIAVRAHCFANNEQIPFHFRTGTAFSMPDSWQRLEAVVGIPPGCDRLHVEVVAALPAAGAWAHVDDVAVTEVAATDAGQATVLENKLAESGQAAIGNDANLAVRSVNTENPATLLQILPGQVPAALQGLQRAGLCTLSDLGASVVCKPTERSFQIEAKGWCPRAAAARRSGGGGGGAARRHGRRGFPVGCGRARVHVSASRARRPRDARDGAVRATGRVAAAASATGSTVSRCRRRGSSSCSGSTPSGCRPTSS